MDDARRFFRYLIPINILSEVIANPYSSPETQNMAILWLQFSKSGASGFALRGALSNPDPTLSLNAAGALMWKGDASGLEVIKRAFLAGGPLPVNLEVTVPNVLKEMRSIGNSNGGAPVLRLTGGGHNNVRRAIARSAQPQPDDSSFFLTRPRRRHHYADRLRPGACRFSGR